MANLMRYDPFREMMSLRDAVNRLMEEAFISPAGFSSEVGVPLDVCETDDRLIIEAALPGVKPEDIDVSVQDNVLTISGELRQEQRAGGEGANYHRVERRYGRFSRMITLPTSVNAEQAQATLENGILRLELPKTEQARARRIAVQGAGAAQRQLGGQTSSAGQAQAVGQPQGQVQERGAS